MTILKHKKRDVAFAWYDPLNIVVTYFCFLYFCL